MLFFHRSCAGIINKFALETSTCVIYSPQAVRVSVVTSVNAETVTEFLKHVSQNYRKSREIECSSHTTSCVQSTQHSYNTVCD